MASARSRPVLAAIARGLGWSVVLALAVDGVLFVGMPIVVLAAVAATVAGALDGTVRSHPDQALRRRMGRTARTAGVTAVATLALGGLTSMLGAAAVPLALVVGALAVARRTFWTSPGGADPRALDDRALARAWAASAAELRRAGHDPQMLDRLARRRGLLLDEIERRNPEGFRRWTAHTGDGSTGDTVPFLGA